VKIAENCTPLDVKMDIDVIVCGAAMIDLIAYASKLPAIGETIGGTSFQQSNGGKGANQAVQAARIGAKVAFIGSFGGDDYGTKYFESLLGEGMDLTASVQQPGMSNGIASIWVDEDGYNAIVIVPGANAYISEKQVVVGINKFAGLVKVAAFQNEIPVGANLAALQAAKALNITTIFNPAPYTDNCQLLMPLASIVCMNEVELAMMASVTLESSFPDNQIVEACNKVLERGPSAVIVTLGIDGARLVTKDKFIVYAAPKVTAVDSVGAGDSFIGCFAALIAQGMNMEEAIRRAVICASQSVQQKGAQPSYRHRAELDSLWCDR